MKPTETREPAKWRVRWAGLHKRTENGLATEKNIYALIYTGITKRTYGPGRVLNKWDNKKARKQAYEESGRAHLERIAEFLNEKGAKPGPKTKIYAEMGETARGNAMRKQAEKDSKGFNPKQGQLF